MKIQTCMYVYVHHQVYATVLFLLTHVLLYIISIIYIISWYVLCANKVEIFIWTCSNCWTFCSISQNQRNKWKSKLADCKFTIKLIIRSTWQFCSPWYVILYRCTNKAEIFIWTCFNLQTSFSLYCTFNFIFKMEPCIQMCKLNWHVKII